MTRKTGKKIVRRKPASTKRKKKSKVYIPLNSIIILSAVVVVLCSALLILNALSSSRVEKKTEKHKIEITKPVKKQENLRKDENTSRILLSPEKETKKVFPKKESRPENKTEKKSDVKNEKSNIKEEKKSSDNIEKKQEVLEVSEKKTDKPPVPYEQRKSDELKQKKEAKPSDIPAIPQAAPGAKLVIIFDDGGQNLNQLEKCVSLPFPVTVAVLPRLAHSKEAAVRVRASGKELILHQPMQSVNQNVNPGEGAIKPGMSEDEIRALLFQNINEIAPVTGMNNHEGSLITANAEQMSYVMKACSDEGIYFLDSRTNVETKVPYVARELGYSYYERNVFLDNKKARADIISEIMKGVAIANKKGVAIMIGHVWSAEILPGILAEMYPLLIEKGYKFTTVSNSGALITPK